MEHLIPLEWFEPLSQMWLLVIAGVSIAVLIKGADWLVEGASSIAYRLGMSKVVVGATVVSLGTTSPECAVSVMAAWQGESGLALGNGIGSIIADTGLIFGLGCVLTRLPADRFVLQRQGWVQAASGLLLAAICYGFWALDGNEAVIARWVGFCLLVLLAAYMVVSVRWSRRHPHGEPFVMAQDMDEAAPVAPDQAQSIPSPTILLLVFWLVVGLVLVVFSSHTLVCSAKVLAERWGVPKIVVASTLVAVGTSLPELMVGMASIYKGHKEILVGNVIGADILNVLFVIGAAAAAKPLPLVDDGSRVLLYLHLPMMIVILLMFRVFISHAIRTGGFHRWHGVPLLVLYGAYVVLGFVFGRA